MSLVYHTLQGLTTGCGLVNLTVPALFQSVRLLHFSQPVSARKWKYFPERDLKAPETFKNVNQPPDRHRLPILSKTPGMWMGGQQKPPRQTKELWRMMGEERVNNDLLLDQFAIVAMTGGMMQTKHFEVIRLGIGKYVKPNKSFAMYRVDPPYKPITDHGFGKRMGGGKGTIDGYGTPVRAGKIIVEVGGKLVWEEARHWLGTMAGKLPFEAMAVNAEMLKKFREEEERLLQTNKNPISFEWLVRNNMQNCQMKLSEYDRRWFGKFVYQDRELNKKWQMVTRAKYRGGN